MESTIKVMMTPNEMDKAFHSEDPDDNHLFSIRYYELQKDVSHLSDEEWKALWDEPFLYKVIVRHAEYKHYLNEHKTYASWGSVVSALKRKQKMQGH